MKLAIIYGTRPEVIKLAPVVEELRKRNVEPTIISTGQHGSLLRGTPADGIMSPTVSLQLPSANDPLLYARDCTRKLAAVFRKKRPDVIVVQGDTASAYAGACVGKILEIPVAHVEAGIRTGDPWDPWPEENFRVTIDGICDQAFCATGENGQNITRMSKWPRVMVVTGNTGIDALYAHTKPLEASEKRQDRILVTLHRRESFGDPLHQMVEGVLSAAVKYPKIEFYWPTHPNPHVQAAVLNRWEYAPPNLIVAKPLETVAFARMLRSARGVITDSGGVQEEAAALGVPCVVAREKTDRPESVEVGLAKLAGRTEDGVLQGVGWALETQVEPSLVFGDGKAAPRIVQHILGD